MICTACESENRDGRKFCGECGARLALACPACGTVNESDEKFCGECGGTLTQAPGATAPSGNARASSAIARTHEPHARTPEHLADKILQSKSAIEGERKQVTVLFADVKGSMELAEQLDAEEWSAIMQRFFEILSQGVERFEGFVDKFTGDGIMALFGAPIAHEDHAQRACYAALYLRDELTRYATEVKREHGIGFSTRMGLHSGDVVVGTIGMSGDDLRMDYTAQGHTVGLAQRMESLAEPNGCYLTAATVALVGGYFALEDLGDFRVRGVADAVHVHRLIGIGAARNRFDISRARGLSRFVGRATDMRTLTDALEQAAAGNGQVVGVVAEAGTGKSRLCFEFLEQCRTRGMQVYEGRAVAHGRNIPFLPILEVFRNYFGITPDDDDRSAREKIAGRMMVLDDKFADALPLLFDFLGVADPQRPAPRLDPEARHRQILAVMRQVIQSFDDDQPNITMIEDLHWLDEASAEFLEHLVDARPGTRSLLLLNFRPEYHADWMQKSWYRQIPLTPLGRDAIAELLTDLLGSDPSIAALATPIHTRTAGNPFFAEEVAQTLIESGHLEGMRGAYRLVTSVDQLAVPATVQAVLAARIDRLPEREKRLLQVASVIGKDFPEPLLADVAELSAVDLKASLAALGRAEFLHEQAIYPVVEYAFKHPLTQEVALGSQLRERRREVHAAVARAIEARDADHLDERAALLAHHFEEAGEALAAARWHRRAAEWVARTDIAAAIFHWQRVRGLLRELADEPEAVELATTACGRLLDLGWRFGMGIEEAGGLLAEGQSLARGLGDRRTELHLSMVHGRICCGAGDVATHVETAIRNQRATLEIDDVALQAAACAWLVDALGFAGRFPELLQIAEEGLARFPRHIPTEGWTPFNRYTMISLWHAYALQWTGRLPESIEAFGKQRRLCEEDGTPEFMGYSLFLSSQGAYLAADAERADAYSRQLDALSRELGEPPSLVGCVHMTYAYAHLVAGRAAEALEAAQSALDLYAKVERQIEGHAASLLAEALLVAGDLSAAASAAENAIAICRRASHVHEPIAHGVLARALLRRDGILARESAEAALASTAALIESTGARALAPALCEWRAELAAVLGDDATRSELLLEARRGYEEIGAPHHVERIARELAS